MIYKKMFFPIGGGEELEERLYGALLVAKYFNTHLEILKSYFKPALVEDSVRLPQHVQETIDEISKNNLATERESFSALLDKVKKDLHIKEDENLKISVRAKEGVRSSMIELYSKISDIVIAAAPPMGVPTATFETINHQSGKPVIMIPRVMRKFSLDSIVVGWNNSPESSRALTASIGILKKAKRVEVITSEGFINYDSMLDDLTEYLSLHGINATSKIVKTTKIPGQVLLNHAVEGDFDIIVAGTHGQKGFRELMLGGTTKHLLENSNIPVFFAP